MLTPLRLVVPVAISDAGFGGLVCTQLIDTFVPAASEAVVPADVSAYEVRNTPPEGVPGVEAFKQQRAAYDEAVRASATGGEAFA